MVEGVQVKRIRYECEACGAEVKMDFEMKETPPARIRCDCGNVAGMEKRAARPAIHFHPTRGKR